MNARDPQYSDQVRAEEASAWCMRLSEGDLDHIDREAFDQWLCDDPANRAMFDRAVITWRDVSEAESLPEFLPLRAAALDSAHLANRQRVSRFLSNRWQTSRALWSVAATLLLAVTGALAFYLSGRPILYETGVGERRLVVLEDGSRLSLDASTSVKVRMAADKRMLYLEHGRARFAVASDPLRPFSVTAGNRMVVATGTQFSVELLKREVQVFLYQGAVAVLEAGPVPTPVSLKSSRKDRWLAPGNMMSLSTVSPSVKIRKIDQKRSLAWEAGELIFVDEPLGSAVERVNRYAEKQLVVGDEAASAVRVTGVFTAGDETAFVEGVTAVFPVKLAQRDDNLVLIHKGK